jgi:ubiquinone/menaquinone biosynthesis C-methylase UbiE
MALVISFVPDPAKAVAEMVRVVRPGGWVVNYMWDIPGGGLPLAPLRKAIQALGLAVAALPLGFEVSRLANLQALWREAGLEMVEGRRIDIEVSYADFDDFWQSNTGLGSPTFQIIRALAPTDYKRVRDWLLPQDAVGRIRYGAYANAVKGRVPR